MQNGPQESPAAKEPQRQQEPVPAAAGPLERAQQLAAGGRYAEAAELLQVARDAEPTRFDLALRHAEYLEKDGRVAAATAAFEQAAKLGTGAQQTIAKSGIERLRVASRKASVQAARDAAEAGDAEAARKHCLEAIAAGDDPALLVELRSTHARAVARDFLQRVLNQKPGRVVVDEILGASTKNPHHEFKNQVQSDLRDGLRAAQVEVYAGNTSTVPDLRIQGFFGDQLLLRAVGPSGAFAAERSYPLLKAGSKDGQQSVAAPISFDQLAVYAKIGGAADRIVDDGCAMRTGDEFRLQIALDQPGYAYVIAVDSVGKVDRLYPDPELGGAAAVGAAGQIVHVRPLQDASYNYWRLSDPPGEELLFVVASLAPLRLDGMDQQTGATMLEFLRQRGGVVRRFRIDHRP